MKCITTILFFLFTASGLFSQDLSQNIITYDIDNFWVAYDKIVTTKGFSEDKKSITFEIELKPDRQYQIIVGNGFRSKEPTELSLKPYLIDFKTEDK